LFFSLKPADNIIEHISGGNTFTDRKKGRILLFSILNKIPAITMILIFMVIQKV